MTSFSSLSTTSLQARQSPSSDNDNDKSNNNTPENDIYFSWKTTLGFVAGQSSLILLAVGISAVAHTPHYGTGPTLTFNQQSILAGLVYTLPLGLFAYLPESLGWEQRFPALQQITMATQRSVLTLLGGQWKPFTALLVCTLLSIAAGVGEEMLFRGLLQYELTTTPIQVLGTSSLLPIREYLAIGLSSLIFGALHAVTPLYACLAGVASIYFGCIYVSSDYNLAVPMVCHAVYDLGALLYAHWTVSQLSADEQTKIAQWEFSSSSSSSTSEK
jgi:membrane protease YdiL (CAAX protease family)